MNANDVRKRLLAAACLVSTVGLTGCWAKVGYSCAQGWKCRDPVIGIEGGTGSGPPPGGMKLMSMLGALSFDASSIYIDTVGTDYNVGSTGNGVITLYNASGGIVASNVFGWVKTGTYIVFQNPTAVENWVNSYPTVANATAEVVPAAIPADGVSHTASSALYVQGVQMASQTRTFPAWCTSPGMNTPYLCAQ